MLHTYHIGRCLGPRITLTPSDSSTMETSDTLPRKVRTPKGQNLYELHVRGIGYDIACIHILRIHYYLSIYLSLSLSLYIYIYICKHIYIYIYIKSNM